MNRSVKKNCRKVIENRPFTDVFRYISPIHPAIWLTIWQSGSLSSFENSWMVQNDFSVDIAIRPVQSHEQTVAITVNIRSLSRIVIENYYPKCYLNKIWKRHNKRPHATLHSIEPIQFERVSVIVIFCSAIRWVFLKT